MKPKSWSTCLISLIFSSGYMPITYIKNLTNLTNLTLHRSVKFLGRFQIIFLEKL